MSNIKYKFLELSQVDAPYRQEITDAVKRVIDSGYYIGGTEVEAFEDELGKYLEQFDGERVVAVSNGLDALRLILRGYIEMGQLHEGDEVIVPANTYVASVLAITDCRLRPVFVEPSLETYNLDTSLIEQAITPRTRAIMPVHLYGRTCWDATLCRQFGMLIIEDNAQAIGAYSHKGGIHGGHLTGTLGDAGAFSFYPTKNIGAMGDAGAVFTHDKELAAVIRAMRNYGSDRRYHNIYRGLNCRCDAIQAAILRVKLRYLDDINTRRTIAARAYDEAINNKHIIKPLGRQPGVDDDYLHVYHQYVVRIAEDSELLRDQFRQYLLKNGVETDVHYAVPPHRQPCYVSEYGHLSLPITERLARTVVSLPIANITRDQAREIAHIINLWHPYIW